VIVVNSVEVIPDFWLLLTFNSGERRCFDMRPYLHYPVFRRLENPAYFSLARIDYGTVTWPGDIDIAPETLYDRSVPLAGDGRDGRTAASPNPRNPRKVDSPSGNPPSSMG
jgi:hypothetical protein